MTFDKLHCAMGTNVCQLFDDIASSFVLNIMSYNEPTNEEIRAMCDELKGFNEEFKIKEVNTTIKNIKAFLKNIATKTGITNHYQFYQWGYCKFY